MGSRNERPGRTGFAHLFEHMMFEGSQNVGKGEHFILVLNNGGGMNGTTNEDRTIYFEELPKNQLDLGLYLEADRMRALNITPGEPREPAPDRRRKSAGRASITSPTAGRNWISTAFPTTISPTSTPPSARWPTSTPPPIQDVADFFRIYYAPNNAVLTLVGDFDPDEALAKVKKYFGSIPAQTPPPKVDLTEEPHYGERSEVDLRSAGALAANR